MSDLEGSKQGRESNRSNKVAMPFFQAASLEAALQAYF